MGGYFLLGKKSFSSCADHLFDVRMCDGKVIEKCYIFSDDYGSNAYAIKQNGKMFPLWHKVLLRPNPDAEIEAKLLKIYRHHLRKIANLKSRKSECLAELAKINAELAQLRGEKR
jgi:hypothetical protein